MTKICAPSQTGYSLQERMAFDPFTAGPEPVTAAMQSFDPFTQQIAPPGLYMPTAVLDYHSLVHMHGSPELAVA